MTCTFRLSIALTVAVFLNACSTIPDISPDPAVQLATALAGTYDRAPDDPEKPLRDRRILLDPLGDGAWLYYQVNEGEDLQDVYRQRVLHLVALPDGSIEQTAYTLKQPEFYQPVDAPVQSLTLDDLDTAFQKGCEMVWRETDQGWAGTVDPQTCVIFSTRRQIDLRIGSKAELIGNRLRQAESGYQMDGTQLWGSKPGEWLTLYRNEA